MQECLREIRRSEVFEFLSDCFIPLERPEELTVVTEQSLPTPTFEDAVPAAPTSEDIPCAYPATVLPRKSFVILTCGACFAVLIRLLVRCISIARKDLGNGASLSHLVQTAICGIFTEGIRRNLTLL